ncbi:MAG: hypothetical protein ACYTFQ_21935 [Planctomycetota bacterium]|jgi:hypothetical protein
MKKIPSVRMPDPVAGVIRSEHPRAVGPRGLVEAHNWVYRNGIVRPRDGITPLDAPGKAEISAGSWTLDGSDIYWAALATTPKKVWIDGELGNEESTKVACDALGDWYYDGVADKLYIYYGADPDSNTNYQVVYDTATDSSSVVGLHSYDYQGQDSSDVQDSVRDQLIAVTDSEIMCYNNDMTATMAAQETSVDWAWQGAVGPGTTPTADYVVSPKISIDWSNIDWSKFPAGTYGVGFELRVRFLLPAGITMRMWTFDDSSSTQDVSAVFDKPSGDADTIYSGEYEGGYPWHVLTQSGAPGTYGTGIYMIFLEDWASWYDEMNAGGDTPSNTNLFYFWAVYQAEENGLPGGQSIVDFDRTTRPVFRNWDYEQTTHVLISAKDKYILDVDSKSLIDRPTNWIPTPSVSVAGDAGVSPRARCIGIASQRVIAGNVSYFDSELTAEIAQTEGGTPPLEGAGTCSWHNVVDKFATFSDAVVYSGTVLTGGHTYWYPADILRLADTPGDIVALQEMGTQQIAVYKTDSIYTLTAQAGISPFAPSLRASGIQGPVGPRAVVALNDQTHLYLGRDGGVYLFSGGTPQSLGDQFREWINREIDPESYADDSFLHFDAEYNEVHVYYPVKGSGGVVRKGMIIDVSKQPFTAWPVLWPKQVYNDDDDTLEDISILCATNHWIGGQDVATSDLTLPAGETQNDPTTRYAELLFGTENKPLETPRTGVDAGRIFKTIDCGNDHGVAIECSMESGVSDLGDPDNQKVLLEMELLFDNIADISNGTSLNAELTIYGGDSNTSLSQLWQDTTISIASGQILVHPRVRARYFSYKLVVTLPVEDYNYGSKDWTQSFGDVKYWGAIARYKVSGVRQN